MSANIEWSAEIKVGEGIVDLLSGRIYRTLPIALKELVSNSWDADAKNVKIFIHQDKGQILIKDDGIGMGRAELENYVNIAMSAKTRSAHTICGRPIIGQYGIGILSAIPFCKKITVQTTQKGSDEVHFLTITTEKWIDDEGRRKTPTSDVLSIECPGWTTHDDRIIESQGTSITLEDVFKSEWNLISSPSDERRNDIIGLSGLDRIKWYLQQYAPIEYPDNAKIYLDFFKPSEIFKPMKLFFNGKQLFRNCIHNPIVLDSNEKFKLPNHDIICRYLIVTPGEIVRPDEMRGLQLRMKNVAIGLPSHFDVYKKEGKLYGRMSYISGEIEIIHGFENQLDLSREQILTCPEFIDFSNEFRERLAVCAELIQNYADVESSLGALGYKSGLAIDEADYGFLGKKAVRASTKIKNARVAKDTKELKDRAIKALTKINYQVEELPKTTSDNDSPIQVDHQKKVVYFNPEKKVEKPIVKIIGTEIFETVDFIEKGTAAKMIDEHTIAFNYNHPLLNKNKNPPSLKEIITIAYSLHFGGEITDKGIDSMIKALTSIVKKDDGGKEG